MTTPSLSPENVSELIDHVLKSKDPATVGLRRVLRRKENKAQEFPLRILHHEEFDTPGVGKKHLTEDESRVLELEKQIHELQLKMSKHVENARTAVQNAYVKGRTEGAAEGKAQGSAETAAVYEKKLDAVEQRLATFIGNLEAAKRTIYSNAQHVLLRFSCELAKKVICSEVEQRPDVILNVIKRALTYIGDRERLVIRVAPGELETVSGRKDFWVPVGERLKDITIEPDERIERGGCIIESNSGIVDARMGVQFTELSELVEKIWENTSTSPAEAVEASATGLPEP